jgi:hypothetical protein
MNRRVFTPEFIMELIREGAYDYQEVTLQSYRGRNGEYEIYVSNPSWWAAKVVVDGTNLSLYPRAGDFVQVDLMAPDSVERLHAFLKKL